MYRGVAGCGLKAPSCRSASRDPCPFHGWEVVDGRIPATLFTEDEDEGAHDYGVGAACAHRGLLGEESDGGGAARAGARRNSDGLRRDGERPLARAVCTSVQSTGLVVR